MGHVGLNLVKFQGEWLRPTIQRSFTTLVVCGMLHAGQHPCWLMFTQHVLEYWELWEIPFFALWASFVLGVEASERSSGVWWRDVALMKRRCFDEETLLWWRDVALTKRHCLQVAELGCPGWNHHMSPRSDQKLLNLKKKVIEQSVARLLAWFLADLLLGGPQKCRNVSCLSCRDFFTFFKKCAGSLLFCFFMFKSLFGSYCTITTCIDMYETIFTHILRWAAFLAAATCFWLTYVCQADCMYKRVAKRYAT
jgi:hypothetical protein